MTRPCVGGASTPSASLATFAATGANALAPVPGDTGAGGPAQEFSALLQLATTSANDGSADAGSAHDGSFGAGSPGAGSRKTEPWHPSGDQPTTRAPQDESVAALGALAGLSAFAGVAGLQLAPIAGGPVPTPNTRPSTTPSTTSPTALATAGVASVTPAANPAGSNSPQAPATGALSAAAASDLSAGAASATRGNEPAGTPATARAGRVSASGSLPDAQPGASDSSLAVGATPPATSMPPAAPPSLHHAHATPAADASVATGLPQPPARNRAVDTVTSPGRRAEQRASSLDVTPMPPLAAQQSLHAEHIVHTAPVAASPSTAEPAIATEHAQSGLHDAIANLRTRSDGTHELSVALHPAELGAVHVRAVLHDGTLTVTVACADDAARHAVTAALPDLQHALSGLGSLDVELHDRAHHQSAPADHDNAGGSATPREDPEPRERQRRSHPSDEGLDRWM